VGHDPEWIDFDWETFYTVQLGSKRCESLNIVRLRQAFKDAMARLLYQLYYEIKRRPNGR
jgi:hypothetical protein